MAIHIQSGKHKLPVREVNVHSIPFKIHADCDANVSKYFNTCIKTNDKKLFRASFRGYPLSGQSIPIPGGYQGLILHESVKPITDKEDRRFYVLHKFSSFTTWNWDKECSKNDKIIQALDWIDIAEALHSPVVEE